MAVIDNRSFNRNKRKEWTKQLKKRQARTIRKGLQNLANQRADWETEGKTLFDLIALYQLTLSEEQIEDYINREKFVVVGLEEEAVEGVRRGAIYFPIFGLQVLCTVTTQGARTTIFLLGNDEVKYLAVCSFMNFIDVAEQLKMVGFFIAREIAAYMNRTNPDLVPMPEMVMENGIEQTVEQFA